MTAPVSPQEIEAIARQNSGYVRSRDAHWSVAAVDTLLRAIAERDASIARIQSAAKMGMDAAGAIAYNNLQRAERLHAESKPEAIDSEREANAALTEECERLLEALAWVLAHGMVMAIHYIDDQPVPRLVDNGDYDSALPPEHLIVILDEALEAARRGK